MLLLSVDMSVGTMKRSGGGEKRVALDQNGDEGVERREWETESSGQWRRGAETLPTRDLRCRGRGMGASVGSVPCFAKVVKPWLSKEL